MKNVSNYLNWYKDKTSFYFLRLLIPQNIMPYEISIIEKRL